MISRLATVTDRIKRLEPKLHALLATDHIQPDASPGSLADMIGTIKDVIVTEGVETTAGSMMLKGWVPPYDATVVARLKAAGAMVVGKTNCDAWAHGSSTENSDFGPTKNPWNLERVPGGSSGGAAAAVAAGYGDFALGSDTGGSIRQPAAFCGVTGLKPTYGRVSRLGLIAMASSFDTIGPLARDAATVARVLEVIAGHDQLDATSVPGKPFSAAAIATVHPRGVQSGVQSKPLAGLRVGIPKEYFGEGLTSEVEGPVRAALSQLEAMGAQLNEISLPSTPHALAAYYIIQPAEVSSNLARFDGIRYGYSIRRKNTGQADHVSHIDLVKQNRAEGFGDEAKRRIILGTFVLSAGYADRYYHQASRVRTLIREEVNQALAAVDVIATPTTPTVAFKLGEKTSDPLTMYLEDIYTVTANLTGNPAVSIPCGFATSAGHRLPVGFQLLGPMFGEEAILRVAYHYQQATDFHQQQSPIVQQ